MLALWKLVETGHAPKFAPVPKDSELTIKPNAPNDLLMGSKIEACYVLCFQYFHKMYIFSVLEVVQDIYSYNLVMCVIPPPSVPLRAKFQENESTFGPDSFWRWLLLYLGTWEK